MKTHRLYASPAPIHLAIFQAEVRIRIGSSRYVVLQHYPHVSLFRWISRIDFRATRNRTSIHNFIHGTYITDMERNLANLIWNIVLEEQKKAVSEKHVLLVFRIKLFFYLSHSSQYIIHFDIRAFGSQSFCKLNITIIAEYNYNILYFFFYKYKRIIVSCPKWASRWITNSHSDAILYLRHLLRGREDSRQRTITDRQCFQQSRPGMRQ